MSSKNVTPKKLIEMEFDDKGKSEDLESNLPYVNQKINQLKKNSKQTTPH